MTKTFFTARKARFYIDVCIQYFMDFDSFDVLEYTKACSFYESGAKMKRKSKEFRSAVAELGASLDMLREKHCVHIQNCLFGLENRLLFR